MSKNPYQSPQENDLLRPEARKDSFSDSAKEIFIGWEKLRLVYNATLVLVTLGAAFLMSGTSIIRSGKFWFLCIEGAIAANLCYFTGPILETYLAWLGWNPRFLRWAFFVSGFLFSIALAVSSVALYIYQVTPP